MLGDRENARVQIFDADGSFRAEWTDVGHPYGLFIGPAQHIYLADAEASRILEIDPNGKILGEFGTAGRGPGQFAGAHALAVTANRKLFVAEVFNWRVEKFVPIDLHP
jgi:DNA-binding beta-propeller fold protein YncE